MTMLVERTNNEKIVITLSASVDSFGLQRLIDYVKYLEATSKSKSKQLDVLSTEQKESIDKGIKDTEEGNSLSNEEANRKIEEWLKK